MSTIKVTGYAKEFVTADVIKYQITVYGDGQTSSKALDSVKTNTEKVLSILVKMGITPDNVRLDKDHVYRQQSYNGKEQLICVERDISFKMPFNAGFSSSLLEKLKESKVEVRLNTDFYYSKEREIQQEIFKKAVINSREIADAIAEASGQSITGIESVLDDKYNDRYAGDDKPLYGQINGIWLDEGETSIADKIKAIELTFEERVHASWNVE